MPDLDRYVKAIQDLVSQIGSPAERLSAMEQATARLRPQGDPRRAAGELVTGLTAMPERMRDMQRLLSEFADPGKQMRQFQEQLSTTRQQLQLMASQLETAETTIGRIADLAERLASFQEPFRNAASTLWGNERGDESDAPASADVPRRPPPAP